MTNESPLRPWGMEFHAFCMLMHLSQLLNIILPFVGVIMPIVMWATNRDKSPIIDDHGKVIVNWLISATIYSIISTLLIAIGIGVLLLLALGICSLVFAIIGGLKANDGVVWQYPLSIRFLK